MLEFPLARTRLQVLDVTENQGNKRSGFFAPTSSRNVDFPRTSHSVFAEKIRDSVSGFLPTIELNQFIEKAHILCILQILNHFRIRTNRIRNIQQRQTHFRSDIVWY